ncbi:hypothetical protein [Thermobifida cellulosilytica]|uniref:DUF3558 domain-containing protein n=1 Tax=Thermobifida cellulosilytica TB100 TaxID=665004 RepID=A0A147KFC1_THECS|nr:hypothetical protein [Thermobifida cellulosilytica]KUP95994.1 hypothetical protein AC529_14380 [Thermobifida cellulosilytica TB100]
MPAFARRALGVPVIAAVLTLPAACASEESSGLPPAPAQSYFPPEQVPWGFDGLKEVGVICEESAEGIDFDNTGSRPLPEPGEADLAYANQNCMYDGLLHGTGGSYVSFVEARESITPAECHAEALRGEAEASYFFGEERTAEEWGIVEGAALCVVTDRNRVVYARIDEVVTGVVEDTTAPPIRGSALLWVPRT